MSDKESGKTEIGLRKIKCPECGKISDSELWRYHDDLCPCEDCGSHPGVQCPECEDRFDHVWGYDELIKSSGEIVDNKI